MDIVGSCGVASALSGEGTDHRKHTFTIRLVSSPTEVRKTTYLSVLLDQDLATMIPSPSRLLPTLAAQMQVRCICVFSQEKGKMRKRNM